MLKLIHLYGGSSNSNQHEYPKIFNVKVTRQLAILVNKLN